MRFDPLRRLERRLPGEDVQPGEVLRLQLGEERPERPDPVPPRDKKALLVVAQRPTRKLATAGPNAPQLIRLIRTPYAMSGVRPVRKELVPPRQASGERPPFGTAMKEALADWPEVRSTSAVADRPRAFAPRPSAAEPIPPAPSERR